MESKMDLQEMIRIAAQEVLKRLQEEADKPCVLVLAEHSDTVKAQVIEYIGDDADIVFHNEDTAGRTPCRYILPVLSCNDMASLAIGKASSDTASVVLQWLLSGFEVEVLDFEYRQYGDTAAGPLYSLYEAHEKTLASFGMKECKRKAPDTIRFRESLVTEHVVVEAHDIGAKTLLVPSSATITPLATEAAKNLHLTILKRL